ncbi:hypothetical protein [Streptomyces sp. NBC_00285]|uniref:hypothetical protein n=1 Tax=Streptomyces sp. NBC_00285 TaxID=2975700 RepID=UPI002E2AADF6|nr:hypothetical protein [Streptomyces sp. NBC_00285]
MIVTSLNEAQRTVRTEESADLLIDTGIDSLAERLYGSGGWIRAGAIPDCAAAPAGVPRPTTLYCQRSGAAAPTR